MSNFTSEQALHFWSFWMIFAVLFWRRWNVGLGELLFLLTCDSCVSYFVIASRNENLIALSKELLLRRNNRKPQRFIPHCRSQHIALQITWKPSFNRGMIITNPAWDPTHLWYAQSILAQKARYAFLVAQKPFCPLKFYGKSKLFTESLLDVMNIMSAEHCKNATIIFE